MESACRGWGRSLVLAGLCAAGAYAADGPPALPGADYAARAAKLEGKKDAKAWLKLADFAEENLLWEKREEALHKALEQDPENAEAHERLDERKWDGKWFPADEAEAKEAEEKQAKGLVLYGTKWVPSKEADRLREADRKAVGWDMEFRLDTPHLKVYSARPLAFTRRLATLLENEVGVYQRLYGKTFKFNPKPPIFRVYVFPDRDTSTRILERDIGSAPAKSTVGIYSTRTTVLYVGVSDKAISEVDVFVTDVCEMSHALDDLWAHVLVASPDWLVEGRANYLGYSIHGRHILPGTTAIPAGDGFLEAVGKEIDAADLRKIMDLDHEAFTQGPPQNHAIAWVWVHFLFHAEGGKYLPGFRTYLQGITSGKADTAHFEKAVGPLSELEPAFKRYVKEMLIPMAEKRGETP